jgi:hypothetical protein
VTVSGTGFGTNPSLQISGSGVTLNSYSCSPVDVCDTTITASVTIDPGAPSENASVTVTSTGYGGSGFLGSTGESPTSGGYSVEVDPGKPCAILVNFTQNGLGTDNGGGDLHFDYSWQSSTGNPQDLQGCFVQEKVQYPGTGSSYTFPSPPFPSGNSPDNPTLGPDPLAPGPSMGILDDQLIRGTFKPPYSAASISATQIYRYYCNCYQNGAWQTLAGPLNIYRQVSNTLFSSVWVYQVCKDNVSPQTGYSCALINPLPQQ